MKNLMPNPTPFHEKIKAVRPRIIVGGTAEKPCFSIAYLDPTDNDIHIGFSSFELKNVFQWLNEEFEAIGDDSDIYVGKWIPLTERLPEETGTYLVTANDGHTQRVTFVMWQKRKKSWFLTGARSYWRVTHWMPLPEAPKGGE